MHTVSVPWKKDENKNNSRPAFCHASMTTSDERLLWWLHNCTVAPHSVTHDIQIHKKGSPYSITERRVPELIPVLGSQPAGDVNHKPSGRLPLLSARPAVTPATLKRAATNFAAWWTEAQWVWIVCLRLLSDSVATAIWTWALLRLSPAC